MSDGKKKDLVQFDGSIDVERPAQKVWDTVLTPRTWVLCFPATVNVGGDAIWEPFKPGNMVIEKFLWGGFMYGVFTYEIGEYKPPSEANPAVFTFEGKQVFTNALVSFFFRKDVERVHCNIRYTFNQKEIDGKVVTNWNRHSFYYHTGGLKTKFFFKTFIFIMKRSLKLEMAVYMRTAKKLMEKDFQVVPEDEIPPAVNPDAAPVS